MKEKKVRQQFADTMLEVGKVDQKLVVLVADISHFILQPFAQACPGRYYNVGICEPTMVSMAAGLSKVGLYPTIHTIAPFLIERSFEQFKLDFCYHQLGGNVVTTGSAFDYSNLGCTHHCYCDFALFKTLQGTQIIYPSTSVEFDTLFRQTYNNKMLTLFRIPGHQHETAFNINKIKLGKGIKVSEGNHLTIIVTGPQLKNAVSARNRLLAMGRDVEILYIHTIRPLDENLIYSSIKKTQRVLVVEEHTQSGGLGDDVLRLISDLSNIEFCSLSIPDKFVTGYGTYEDHCQSLGLTPQGIIDKVLKKFSSEKIS